MEAEPENNSIASCKRSCVCRRVLALWREKNSSPLTRFLPLCFGCLDGALRSKDRQIRGCIYLWYKWDSFPQSLLKTSQFHTHAFTNLYSLQTYMNMHTIRHFSPGHPILWGSCASPWKTLRCCRSFTFWPRDVQAHCGKSTMWMSWRWPIWRFVRRRRKHGTSSSSQRSHLGDRFSNFSLVGCEGKKWKVFWTNSWISGEEFKWRWQGWIVGWPEKFASFGFMKTAVGTGEAQGLWLFLPFFRRFPVTSLLCTSWSPHCRQ